jgi:poly(3-hydroxybutyrate) depolymerase
MASADDTEQINRLRSQAAARQAARNIAPGHAAARAGQLQLADGSWPYLYYRPIGESPAPMLVLLAEKGQSAAQAWRLTSLPRLAQTEHFSLVVLPLDGLPVRKTEPPGDQLAALHDAVEKLGGMLHMRSGERFMAGTGTAGLATMQYACRFVGDLRASASGGVALPRSLAEVCQPGAAPAWLLFDADADVVQTGGGAHGELLSVSETFRFWGDMAGCGPAVDSQRLSGSPVWLSNSRSGCDKGGPVMQYLQATPWSGWPSGRPVDAGETIWRFFQATLHR